MKIRNTTLSLLSALMLTLPAWPALAEKTHNNSYAGGGFQGPTEQATQAQGMGGFQGPTEQPRITTVAEARKARHKARVVLTGNIVKQLAGDDDDYLFRDATGEIRVDIDRRVFRGQIVRPETRVRLIGKMDNEFMERIEVEVKHLEVL